MTTFTFKFDYNNKQTQPFTCQEDEKIEGPFGKFASSENKSIEDFAFYYKTFLIKDFNKSLNETIFINSGKKEIMILAILLKLDKSKEENAKEKKETIPEEKKVEKKEDSKEEKKEEKKEEPKKEVLENYFDVICPECKTSAIIDIDNDERRYDLKILNCENFHNLRKLNYDIYEQFNIFDTKDDSFEHLEELLKSYSDLLKCGQCGNNRLYMTPPEDKLSFCFACGINICPECMNTHDKDHKDKIFPLEDKNYYCIKHAKKFISYCIDCNCNICEDCKSSHPDNEHETYDFDKIKPSQDDIKEFSKKVEEHKKQLKNFISSTKEFFNKMITTVETYINSYILIESTLIKRFKEDKKMNFQLIRNLSNEKIFDNVLFNDLENPPREDKDSTVPINPFEKIKLLNDIYKKINLLKKKRRYKISTWYLDRRLQSYLVETLLAIAQNPGIVACKLMLQSFTDHLVSTQQVGCRNALAVWRVHHDDALLLRLHEVLEVALLYRDVAGQSCRTHIQTGGIHSLHVDVVAVDVMVELPFLRIVIIDIIEQVAVEVLPLLEGKLLAEQSRSHIAGYQGSLDEQRTATAHRVDEVGLAMPSRHQNHTGCQHLVERSLHRLLSVAATVQRFAAGVQRECAPVFRHMDVQTDVRVRY